MSWIISPPEMKKKSLLIYICAINRNNYIYFICINCCDFDCLCTIVAVRPYTEEVYEDDTMTVYQVPLFGESQGSYAEDSVNFM